MAGARLRAVGAAISADDGVHRQSREMADDTMWASLALQSMALAGTPPLWTKQEVILIQTALVALGYEITIDGAWGKRTGKALATVIGAADADAPTWETDAIDWTEWEFADVNEILNDNVAYFRQEQEFSRQVQRRQEASLAYVAVYGRPGWSDEDVATLQAALRRFGHEIAVDGLWSQETVAALTAIIGSTFNNSWTLEAALLELEQHETYFDVASMLADGVIDLTIALGHLEFPVQSTADGKPYAEEADRVRDEVRKAFGDTENLTEAQELALMDLEDKLVLDRLGAPIEGIWWERTVASWRNEMLAMGFERNDQHGAKLIGDLGAPAPGDGVELYVGTAIEDGHTHQVVLRFITPGMGAAAPDAFLRGAAHSDGTLYYGHGRSGYGPDFDEIGSGAGNVLVNRETPQTGAHVDDAAKGTQGLSLARNLIAAYNPPAKPRAVMLMACTSVLYIEEMKQWQGFADTDFVANISVTGADDSVLATYLATIFGGASLQDISKRELRPFGSTDNPTKDAQRKQPKLVNR